MTTGGVDARAEAAAYEARMSEYRFWLEILNGWRMDYTAAAGDEAAGRAARWLVHEIARIKRILGERQPRDLDKVRAQTKQRVRRHRERRRYKSADEIAAERKAERDYREERAREKRLAVLMKALGKVYAHPQAGLGVAAAAVKLLSEKGREVTPEAVADVLDGPMSVGVAADALEALKLMGHYDRIVAEAKA
jgi:hypothetical protein